VDNALGSAGPSGPSSELDPLPFGSAARALGRCALQTSRLVVKREIRQPRERVGTRIGFADGTTGTVYRETVIRRGSAASPAVLVVGFKLRHVHMEWAHGLFRLESELNTILFAGFPGLISKLWLRHDEHDYYRGFYEWDGPDLAVAYVRALWWMLGLVSDRGSIRYAVLPGLARDAVLANPDIVDAELISSPGGWWRPESVEGGTRR
jgi:hypothetical protein